MNRQALDAAWRVWARSQPGPEPGAEWRVLRVTAEQAIVVQQELHHTAHKLEAQARQASPRGNRQQALRRRAEHLRAVADQLS
jgi:ABC-type uncharacterized transport system permease subunit